MALRGKLKHLTGVFLILVLLGGYVAATTLSEIKEVAKSSEQGDITLQWSPSNPWPGQIVQRSDGTTIYMEPNFWNIASGDGENYMRFISSEDTIAFYANMSNIERTYTETAPRWDGSTSPIDALATPNVIFVGRAPAAWWGDKPLVGGYDFFSLPVNGADVSTLGEVWARVDFEMAKSEETLARTGLIMWFESPDWDPYGTGKAWPLAEVYIAFQDDFFYDDHEKNLQYPPADIGTLTATVYVNGAPKEVEFKVQRAWNADHFVIKFVPTEPITTGGSVTLNVTPFAERSIQAIVDDPYSDWTADQITWTSIGFGTYTGSNGNSFELGWILKEAGVFESLKEALFYKVKNLSTEAEPGDVVLQWTSGDYWAPPYDDNGVTRQVCTWPGQLVTRSDNTTLWVEPNFWNIAGGDGENYMRFISSEDTVVFYVNMTNIQTRYGGIAWATPNVVLAGRVPPSLSGGTPLPRAGGYGWFDLPMPAKDRTNYASILAKVDFELVKSENTLVRPGFMMWFEKQDGYQLAEVYISFFDDYGGIVGAQFPPADVGSVTLTVRINGEAKNVTFRVQKAWNWNNFAFDFIPEKPLATSGEVIVDLRPVVDKVVKEIIADEYSDYTEGDIIWSSLAFGTYTGSNGNNFELGWILYDARVIQLTAPPTPEKKLEEKPTEASNIFTVLGFYYYFNYQRDLNKYMILKENLSSLNDNLTAIAQTLKELGEKEYSEASRISGGAVYTQAGNLRVFVHLRKAFLFMRAAKEVSEYSLKYHSLLKEYESLLLEAQYLNIEPELIEKAEELKTQAENEYMNAISYPKGDLKVVKYIKNAYWLIKEATEELEENVIFSTKFKEFWSIASTKGPGDIQFTWWDQWLEEPIQLSDGRTVWMQTNFWNIIGGQGEVFMRYIHRTDEFAFYVNLEKVETQWGGIAWATPEVIFAGRSPAVWWGGKPKVGGYGFFDLPLKASEINNYDSIWVKVDYNVTKRSDTLVRFGIGIWFENIEGWPAAEVYIPFFDDFGGLVLSDKENLGEVTTTMVINGRATQASFTLQRGWNPGNWWSFEFIPEDPVPSGEVYIDVKPLVAEIAKIIGKENTWVSMAVGSYSGSKGTGFQYGWIIHDVRVVKPEDVPSIG